MGIDSGCNDNNVVGYKVLRVPIAVQLLLVQTIENARPVHEAFERARARPFGEGMKMRYGYWGGLLLILLTRLRLWPLVMSSL